MTCSKEWMNRKTSSARIGTRPADDILTIVALTHSVFPDKCAGTSRASDGKPSTTVGWTCIAAARSCHVEPAAMQGSTTWMSSADSYPTSVAPRIRSSRRSTTGRQKPRVSFHSIDRPRNVGKRERRRLRRLREPWCAAPRRLGRSRARRARRHPARSSGRRCSAGAPLPPGARRRRSPSRLAASRWCRRRRHASPRRAIPWPSSRPLEPPPIAPKRRGNAHWLKRNYVVEMT